MAKKIQAYIKLQVKAGEANPSPPVGPALGQHGVNIMEFCKAFNAQTQQIEKGLPIPVVITVYSDRSFTFVTKTPPASVLLMKAVGIPKGSSTPNTNKVGTVSRAQLEAIATTKMPDLNAADLDAAVRIVAGTARSMGLDGGGLSHGQTEQTSEGNAGEAHPGQAVCDRRGAGPAAAVLRSEVQGVSGRQHQSRG